MGTDDTKGRIASNRRAWHAVTGQWDRPALSGLARTLTWSALALMGLQGCGDDGGSDGGGAAVVTGCDQVEYEGRAYSGFGCVGNSAFSRTLTADAVETSFLVQCDDDCVRTAFAVEEGADAGMGTAPPSAGGGGSDNPDGAAIGGACEANRDCAAGLTCDVEVTQQSEVSGLPGGEASLSISVFLGGSCTPSPAGPMACNPTRPPGDQGCGRDGVCAVELVDSTPVVACRASCDPSVPDSCGRPNYRCDVGLGACVEGCQSDDQCRVALEDADGDGNPDSLVYDGDSSSVCETDTGRCVLPDGDGGETGDSCERQDDCEATGVCRTDLNSLGGFGYPDGYCSKVGCDLPGNECGGEDAVCARLRSWQTGVSPVTSCMTGCEVGAESEADQTGVDGHGEGCRDGYRCHFNGGSGGGPAGVCVGGNYNDITESNLGGPCAADSECYSPFGLGQCVSLGVQSQSGVGQEPPSPVCTVLDCAAPGLPEDICGPNGTCLILSGDVTFCAPTCIEASDCAPGFACADDDARGDTPNLCFPVCASDDECRKGEETCQAAPSGFSTCQPAPSDEAP